MGEVARRIGKVHPKPLNPKLQGPLAALREAARRVGKVQAQLPGSWFACTHIWRGVELGGLLFCSCALLCMARECLGEALRLP